MIHGSIASEVGVRAVETRPVIPSKQLMPDLIVKFRKEKFIQWLNQPNNQSSLTPLIVDSSKDEKGRVLFTLNIWSAYDQCDA